MEEKNKGEILTQKKNKGEIFLLSPTPGKLNASRSGSQKKKSETNKPYDY